MCDEPLVVFAGQHPSVDLCDFWLSWLTNAKEMVHLTFEQVE